MDRYIDQMATLISGLKILLATSTLVEMTTISNLESTTENI